MRILLSLIALFGVIAIADVGLSPSANATAADQRCPFAETEQTRVARVSSHDLLVEKRSPCMHQRSWSTLLVALRSSHLPLVMRSQRFDKQKR